MKNRLAGFENNRGYKAIWLFPFGFEVFSEDIIEISFIFHPVSFSFNIGKNLTLFRND